MRLFHSFLGSLKRKIQNSSKNWTFLSNDKLHASSILTVTEVTLQSSGHQLKCFILHLDKEKYIEIIKYLTTFADTTLGQISLELTNYCRRPW